MADALARDRSQEPGPRIAGIVVEGRPGGRRREYGAIRRASDRGVEWQCRHFHTNRWGALGCARTELAKPEWRQIEEKGHAPAA